MTIMEHEDPEEEVYKAQQAALAEYKRRLKPASNDEIIMLAQKLWAAPKLRTAFLRVGNHGDFTEEEQAAIDVEIDEYRQGPLWNRDELHLWLATCLARHRASGTILDFDNAEVTSWLEDHKVERVGIGLRSTDIDENEVIRLAQAMRDEPSIWKIFRKIKSTGQLTPEENDAINNYIGRWRRKYCSLNTGALRVVIVVLRLYADNKLSSLNDESAREIIRRYGRF